MPSNPSSAQPENATAETATPGDARAAGAVPAPGAPSEAPAQPKVYWKSLDERVESPKFRQWAEREFPEGATVSTETDRRDFLKIMGASMGLAGLGLSGCRFPERRILPYAKQPEQLVPGVAMYYASSFPGSAENVPLIVETHEARPTKVEGNPSHAPSAGGCTSYAQASVLDLYDPDRLRGSRNKGGAMKPEAVRAFLDDLHATHVKSKGQGLALVLPQTTSPSIERLIGELKTAMPKALIARHEAVDFRTGERALRGITGKPLRAVYHLDKAKRVLTLDSDCLATEPGHLANARAFAKGRHVVDHSDAPKMNRLYAIESNFTLTGAMADHRLRSASAHIPAIAARVLLEVIDQDAVDSPFSSELLQHVRKQAATARLGADTLAWLKACVADLHEFHDGRAVVVPGAQQSAQVHVLAYVINQLLGADGVSVTYHEVADEPAPQSLPDIVAALNGRRVTDLVLLGGNPVYDAPADLRFADAVRKAGRVIRLGYHADETSQAADVRIAQSHYLESWGDGRAFDGTYVPVQPMILPLFETFSELEVLTALATGKIAEGQGYEQVRETFETLSGQSDDLAFDTWLAEGVREGTAFTAASVGNLKGGGTASRYLANLVLQPVALSAERLECRVIPSTHAYDGRYNNNGWLMECPDPMTKLTWDNAISVSPKLAKHLGIAPGSGLLHGLGALQKPANTFDRNQERAPMAKVTVNGREMVGPVHIQPGLADWTLVLPLGFGRKATGRVGTRLRDPGKGTGIGFDFYPATTAASPALAVGAKIEILADQPRYLLANTQEHWSMEGRAILRESTPEEYAHDPHFVDHLGAEAHSPPIYGKHADKSLKEKTLKTPRGNSLYDHPTIPAAPPNVDVWQTEAGKAAFKAPQQWGMAIDLNSCIGCNACVIACQSENNIPIVGKDQVSRGREMHWIRLDRYYAAPEGHETTELPEDPQVSFMGMACVHCENAPCESVCPVNATVHDEEGLNVMAYNRCVGTRYCSNNCPYKVRRFNFFDYNKRVRGDFYKGPVGKNFYEDPDSQLTRLQKNPDVTVRMRGVMEKCTYCVQRIQEAKINHKAEAAKAGRMADVEVPDGTIKVACQQTCPTGAITFGDITDETSEVYRMKQSERDYSVLGYLNVRPRTTYLAKLRNPNPKMPSAFAYDRPFTRGADHGGHGAGHDGHADAHHSDNGAHHGNKDAHGASNTGQNADHSAEGSHGSKPAHEDHGKPTHDGGGSHH